MLYDSTRCVGCRACQTACKRWNNLPAESIGYGGIYDSPRSLSAQTWTLIKARDITTNGQKDLLLCKYQCMHCTEAACVKVCPTHALTHHPLGFVAYNEDICSGCGYCTEFCPFQVPRLAGSTLTGIQKMHKCTFCQDRVPEGRQTACAEACPAGAILFGNREELVAEGKKRVGSLKPAYPNARLYGEKELGGLHVMYVLKEPPSVYQFPEYPEVPQAAVAWKDVIQPLGWAVGGLTILGLGLNYLVARASVKSGKEK
jgi:formate dehydrogenase iron-sulfur subunit